MLSQFVSAYNGLTKFLSSATAYDPNTKSAALFQGDSTMVTLQNQLRSMLGQSGLASSAYSTLSDLGVQLQKDGTLKLNDATLTNALANNPSEVARALAGSTTNGVTIPGLTQRFSDWSAGLLSSSGTLATRNDSLQREAKSNQTDQTNFQTRLDLVQKRIRAQYTALDATMSQANSLSNYVSQQLTALANNTKAASGR